VDRFAGAVTAGTAPGAAGAPTTRSQPAGTGGELSKPEIAALLDTNTKGLGPATAASILAARSASIGRGGSGGLAPSVSPVLADAARRSVASGLDTSDRVDFGTSSLTGDALKARFGELEKPTLEAGAASQLATSGGVTAADARGPDLSTLTRTAGDAAGALSKLAQTAPGLASAIETIARAAQGLAGAGGSQRGLTVDQLRQHLNTEAQRQ
jgi:hypothetical protein